MDGGLESEELGSKPQTDMLELAELGKHYIRIKL